MVINVEKEGSVLNIELVGRLDTTTAPQLEEEVKKEIEGMTKLCLDFQQLDYISSAGLRVLLATQKIMDKQGEMVIRNANEVVLDVFKVTGFADILTIE